MAFLEYELNIIYFIDCKIIQLRLINFTITLCAKERSKFIFIDNDVL